MFILHRLRNKEFGLGRVENFVGKKENAGYQHFLLFPRFQKAFFSRSLNALSEWLSGERVGLMTWWL